MISIVPITNFCVLLKLRQYIHITESWFIMTCHELYLTDLLLDKMATISQTTCSNAFPWMKRYEYQNFIEICSRGFNWQYVSIGSDNGLVLPRWTDVDPVHRCIYAALGRDDNLLYSRYRYVYTVGLWHHVTSLGAKWLSVHAYFLSIFSLLFWSMLIKRGCLN